MNAMAATALILLCALPGCAPSSAPGPGGGLPRERLEPLASDAVPSRGPAAAPVRIVEFADFRCGHCRRAVTVMNRVLEAYPGRVRHEFRHFPGVDGDTSVRAALGAASAQRQGRFWEMHELLFEMQGEPIDEDALRARATQLGLDVERFSTDLRGPETAAVVNADIVEADRLGVRGTPGFFVNGLYLRGYQSFEALRDVIEAELAKAGP